MIQKPGADFDVTWGGWGADWASIGTVIPPLFDSRINITRFVQRQRLRQLQGWPGGRRDDRRRLRRADLDAAAEKWAALDAKLGEDVAYIPLEITIFNFLHGSKVTGYANNSNVNGYADLAAHRRVRASHAPRSKRTDGRGRQRPRPSVPRGSCIRPKRGQP